ncbi:putative inositol monophosphatase 3 [Cephus cinctus]|uniref:inositol-phosphate phosphatase n=1 Tax=Cephus cinctus TaxID=211228 RepID=A0AAJ7FIR4_CEPCN|nr:putative inositol monophosphatase 3 [Cephus cinctus]
MHLGANVRISKIGLCVTVGFFILLYLYSTRGPSYSSIDNRYVISLKALLAGSIRAAKMGGSEVVLVHNQNRLNIESKGKTKEGVNDPVTAADYRSHCAMYHSLIEAFPKITVISEEMSKGCDQIEVPSLKDTIKELDQYGIGSDIAANANDVTVWIDPLDATKEFTENLLQYVTTMVCVAIKGEPVIGVIFKPFEPKTTYWAWVDHGVSPNLRNLPQPKEGRNPVLIVSRSHAGRVHNASKLALGDNVQVISAAGSGYKSLEVAVGNATAYVHMTAIKKWDVCAGAAIISALGGSVTPLSGPPPMGFGPTDSTLLNSGLLATMQDHKWYLDKFYNV